MKKIRNLVIMLALTLAMVGLIGATDVKAEDETAPSFTYAIDYVDETITVTPTPDTMKVYYAAVKADDTEAKSSALLLAEGGLIDISTLTSKKDACIGIYLGTSVDLTVKTAKLTGKIKIDPGYTKLVVTLDLGVDAPEALTDIISSITTTDSTKKVTIYQKAADDKYKDDSATPAEFDMANLQVKKGKNGMWKSVEDFTLDKNAFVSFKNSGTTLYFRAVYTTADTSNDTVGFACSKEAKVKIPKTAKAPSVKVDYEDGTIAIKNGMQFRLADDDWMTVLPTATTVSTTGVIVSDFKVGDSTAKDNKVSELTIAELVDTLSATADSFIVEVRVAATAKKVPSAAASLTLKMPAKIAAGTGTVTYATGDSLKITIADGIFKVNDVAAKFDDVEYVLVKGSDVGISAEGTTIADFDPVKTKWTKAESSELSFDKKAQEKVLSAAYYTADGDKKQVKPGDADYIIVRTPADEDNKIFPGQLYALKLK